MASSLLLVTCPGHLPLPAGLDHHPARRDRRPQAHAARWTPPRSPRRSRSPPPTCPATPPTPDALPGVLYGANTAGPGLVAWDRWAQRQPQLRHPRRSGAGKSYLAKLEILRNAYQGTECWIIDPEDEYARLAAGTGGAYLHLGAAGVRLNPFDLPRRPAPGRARTR